MNLKKSSIALVIIILLFQKQNIVFGQLPYSDIKYSYGTDKNRKYRGWFVGMAPIDNPRIVVAVMIDEPTNGKYYGGEVAAPVFSDTVQQTLRALGVQPDMAVRPQIVAQSVEESF